MTRHSPARNMPRPALRPWQVWVLAGLLLAAQALGLAHRVEHAPGSLQRLQAASLASLPSLAEVAPAAASAQWGAPHTAAPGTLDHGLSRHQAGDADCRLVDQLTHADALCPAPAGSAAMPPPPRLAPAPAARLALRPAPAAYQARAPPRA